MPLAKIASRPFCSYVALVHFTDVVNTTTWKYSYGGNIGKYTHWVKNGGKHRQGKRSCVYMSTSDKLGYWRTTSNCNLPKSSICQIDSNTPVKQVTQPSYVFKCDRKWKVQGNRCYYFYKDGNKNFYDAQYWCQGKGGDMAVIPDQDTQDFITDNINQNGKYWIGLIDMDTENAFTWIDTETDYNYTNWIQGQPDNFNGQENCVSVIGKSNNEGKWNDDQCNKKLYFICQKNAAYVQNIVKTTTPKPISVKCGPFWEEDPHSDFCYQFWDKDRIWNDARAMCGSNGGDLLSITSSVEQAYVTGRIKGMTSEVLWIGANDLKREKGFQWTDRSPFPYMNWLPGEPNNNKNSEDCVSMFTSSGMWNDWKCTNRAGFVCKKLGKTTATPSQPTTPPASTPEGSVWGCPRLWRAFRGSCYLYVPEKLTQGDAESNCRVQSGNLASIAGPAENKFLLSMLPNAGRHKDNRVWLGFNDIQSESEFVWSDGERVTYTNWADGDPNNYKGDQDCVSFLSYHGGWIDENCGAARSSVCRKARQIISGKIYTTGCEKYPGSLGYRGRCYQFNTSPDRSWMSSEKYCKKNGGHLATIYDNHVQAFLAAEISLRGDDFWIGLSDYLTPGRYSWSTGMVFDYTNWSEKHTGNEKKTCVAMQAVRPIGLWRNGNCTDSHSSICELPRQGSFTNPVITQTTASSLPCPTAWKSYQGYCYKAFTSQKSNQQSWTEALTSCQSLGGDLASIHKAEQESFFQEFLLQNQTGYFWIGLNDRATERSHSWSDGSPFDYANWADKEPNDWNHQEDCVQYSVQANKWMDDNCYLGHNFICQLQKGLTPPTTNVPPTAVTSVEQCGNSSWLFYDNYCYYLSPEQGSDAKKNFYDAERFCNSQGAHLSSVHSAEENGFLTTLMSKHHTTMFYIGLNDLDLGPYKWTDGSTVRYLAWGPSQPNDDNGGERCVQIYSNRGVWVDIPCGMVNGFVCKKSTAFSKIITPPSMVVQQGGCPSKFTAAQGSSKCFYVGGALSNSPEHKMNFTDALSSCSALGPGIEIASINSYIEQLTVTMMIKNAVTGIWIGLNDRRRNGLFVWHDNTEVAFTNWGRKEPNENLKDKTDQQDCVMVIPRGRRSGGYWVDAACSMKRGFLCQTKRNPVLANPIPSKLGCTVTGYQRYDRSCYSLKTDKKNWQDAQTQCQQDGGNLASIWDIYEQAFVSLLSKSMKAYSWIGLNDQVSSGDYHWNDNSPVTFTNWAYNEPSKRDGEGCVAMKLNDKFDDVFCNSSFPYICKIVVEAAKPTTKPVQAACGSIWIPYKDRCFKDFSNRNMSWADANTRCKRMRGDLISIHDEAEDSFVKTLIKYPDRDIWLGLIRAENGGYQNSDNTPLNYVNWDDGEPSDANNTMHQDCVARVTETGKWDDLTCNFKKGFICVKVMATSKVKQSLYPVTVKQITNRPITAGPVLTNKALNPFTNRPGENMNPATLHNRFFTVDTGTRSPFTDNTGNGITAAPQKQPRKGSSSGLSDGGVVGIVFAVLFSLIVSFVLLYYLSKKYQWTFNSIRHAKGFDNALYNINEDTVTVTSDAQS
ncbi:hypothetical protein LOTGIDRAFT_161348 [Lottia gigantea]|uniref:C-type lectin domain-containing protein n=1 Tax=Lottia gigantea TaxID=225164 RepID=V3ZRU6_LOTGI|nr:hypothetical protein LOTGIDRAFT_161348 [Lottia gigantea]ESO94148.1 hypothetical protein LOTGIDRAFT_161348 [Lottia gigantea]